MILQKTRIALVGEDWDVIDLIENLSDLEIAGLFALSVTRPGAFPYLGADEDWKRINNDGLKVILAVDLPSVRAQLFTHYGLQNLYTLQSSQAYVSNRAKIGIGSIIQRGVTIMPHSNLGMACKVNVNATIHHDAQIGNFCTIAPQALILGNVVIEDEVYIGAGAIIKQRCRVGAGSVIGAGAVVIKDVPPKKTFIGVPAREKS